MVRSDHANNPVAKPLRLVVLLGLGLSLTACATSPPGKTAFFWPVGATYRVRPGDTLSRIAGSYHIPYTTLAAYNRIRSAGRIYPGEVLRIPPANYVAAAPAAAAPVTVAVAHIVPTPRPRLRLAAVTRSGPPVAPSAFVPTQAPFTPHKQALPRRLPLAVASAPQSRALPRPLLPATPAPTLVARNSAPTRLLVPPDAAPAAAGAPRFLWPVAGKVIEGFGALPDGGRNDGINIATREGAPIRAAASGTVIYAGDGLKAYGNLVLIRHRDGYITAYAHAERLLVARNTHVTAGEVIGYAGTTGGMEVPQLHFEIRHGVKPLNPTPLLMASASS
jgi:murein DD-endopeptidase MepM/ murein hydrolase activator NlpD